jgi:hypothetical protein
MLNISTKQLLIGFAIVTLLLTLFSIYLYSITSIKQEEIRAEFIKTALQAVFIGLLGFLGKFLFEKSHEEEKEKEKQNKEDEKYLINLGEDIEHTLSRYSTCLRSDEYTLFISNLEHLEEMISKWATLKTGDNPKQFKDAFSEFVTSIKNDQENGQIIKKNYYPEIRRRMDHWKKYFIEDSNESFNWKI